MSLRHIRRVALAITCAAVLSFSPTNARGNAFDLDDTTWQGCSLFIELASSILGSERVVVKQHLDWENLRPEDGLMLIHPAEPINPDDLSAFLRAGGRVAVMDDFGASSEILGRYHIERTQPPRMPARSLRNNPALAIAEPVADLATGRSLGVHPVVANVTQVVTNHPSAFLHPNLTAVLQIRGRGEPDATIAVAGQVGRGRLLAVSDPSIIINQMLRFPGNRELGLGIVRYLIDDDVWGQRAGRLYIVTNNFGERGAFGRDPTASRTMAAWARSLAGWIKQGHEGLPRNVAMVVGALAALATLAWLAASAARGYRGSPPRFARPVPLVAQGGWAGRAAVLAAPSTHRALAMLELKSAFEEAMAARFSLDVPVAAEALMEAAQRSGHYNASELQTMKRLLFTLAMIETSVVAGTPSKLRDKDIRHLEASVAQILARIDDASRAYKSSQPEER